MKKLLSLFIFLFFTAPFFFNIAKADSGSGSTFTVTKTAAPSTVGPNGNVSFTISIKNITTANAAPIEVKDTLPNGFVYNNDAKLTNLSGVASAFNPTVSGQVVTWLFDGSTLISIPANQNIVISFSAKAPANVGTYVNQACLVRPEQVCANATVVVQNNPAAGIIQTTGLITSVSTVAIVGGMYLRKDRRSFEAKVLNK